jgi:hypothetical protein
VSASAFPPGSASPPRPAAPVVQLLDMVDKSIPLRKPTSGRFFHHGADRRGQLLLERGSIRLLLLSLAPPTPHHDTATAPGCRRLKRKPESRGKKAPRAPSIVGSFSPQPWLESAGDRVAPDVCPLVLAAAQASPAAIHGGATSVIVRSPPLQMGQQMGRLLRCGPGSASQSGQAMADGQIHPLDKSRVQPSREAYSL